MRSPKLDELMHYQKNGVSVESQVSVESENFVSTGVVTYIEGDIIEIELSQWKSYKPGEIVKLTFYSNSGFLILYSSVIARDTGVITVLNPPENQRLTQRRQFARVDVNASGTLFTLQWTKQGENKLEYPVVADVRNISMGGIGFYLSEDPGIRAQMIAELELHLENQFKCFVQISRTHTTQEGIYIGAHISEIDPLDLTTLRGIILRRQLALRANARKIGQSAI